ncbi:hypothetical protein [Psychrobacillus sp. FJAT-21963]|uniref:hypothetical protein n=1 Tax=Psychrobacillus sp. FJAT-21963 TaxID=1712028 RepID=UPI0012E15BDC|nr:hypothetical protein [Psychrobacillus sp. FJAT-21963]
MSYLNLQSPKENKSNIIGFFILFLYFFGILPILADPFSLPFFIAAIIPVIIIQIWAIVYVIDPYKYEKSYYLFFGIYGVVNTYVYFVSIQKLLYINLKAEGILPFLIGLIFLVALLLGMNWLNWKALYSGTYYKLQQKSTIPVAWTVIAGGSYILGQLILSFIYTESALYILIIVGMSFFSLCTAYFSVYIHRYYFMNKNMDAVKQVYPQFGLPKSERVLERKKRKKKVKS